MFNEALDLELALTVDGTAYKVAGGQVKNFTIDLTAYGFEAELDFWVSSDDREDVFYAFFTKHGLVRAALTLSAHNKPDGDSVPDPLVVTGLVTDKRMFEETYPDVAGNPVVYRRYWIRFADAAEVLWRQHSPSELYVDQTMKSVLDAHRGEVEVAYDLPALDHKQPIIFLGLGCPEERASFYDFVHWYAASQNAVVSYSSATTQYTIAAEKGAVANAGSLDALDVASVEVVFPETPRHVLNVLNAVAVDPKKDEATQPNAVDGVRRDLLLRDQVVKRFDDAAALARAGFITSPEHRLEVTFARFPTITLYPGTYINFEDGSWSSAVFQKNNVYRARWMHVRAYAEHQEHHVDLGVGTAAFDVEVLATLELAGDKSVERPPCIAPRYPALVEGLMVSEAGAEKEETYQIYPDSATSVDQYKVTIPLWDDKVVVVDFNPNTLPGHLYFPYFKKARVLVALELHRAWIKRFLEWRPGARLPEEGQGNHVLFGKTESDKTSLNHVYVDAKPVLNLKRTFDKDTEMIELTEGALIIQTKEEG